MSFDRAIWVWGLQRLWNIGFWHFSSHLLLDLGFFRHHIVRGGFRMIPVEHLFPLSILDLRSWYLLAVIQCNGSLPWLRGRTLAPVVHTFSIVDVLVKEVILRVLTNDIYLPFWLRIHWFLMLRRCLSFRRFIPITHIFK